MSLCSVVSLDRIKTAPRKTEITYTSDDTKTTCVTDGSSELWACRHVHTRKHYRVLDLQEISDRGLQLLRRSHGEQG